MLLRRQEESIGTRCTKIEAIRAVRRAAYFIFEKSAVEMYRIGLEATCGCKFNRRLYPIGTKHRPSATADGTDAS